MFTEEEQKAYSAKLREILIDRFSEEVLKTLMDHDEDNPPMKYKASDRYALSSTEAALANKLNITFGDYAKIKTDMEKIK
jgi:hypothetical protein